jgi:hypothetical protein
MGVTIGRQKLLYEGTHRSSGTIIWGYPQVLQGYYMEVPIGPEESEAIMGR